MNRISFPAVDTATGDVALAYGQVKKLTGGPIPNLFATVGHVQPKLLSAFLAADGAVGQSSLSRKEQEIIKLVVSELAGCDYCVAAHTMLGKAAGLARDDMRAARSAQDISDPRLNALAQFVRAVQSSKGTVPESLVTDLRAAGYSDAHLVEISLAIATTTFTNVFNRINDTVVDFPNPS